MALLTPLPLETARALASDFGLDVVDSTPIAHGSVNSNFALALANGSRAFLRIYEESDAPSVEVQNRLLAHLIVERVPTPAPLESASGQTLALLGDKPVCIFPFVEGTWLCQERVAPRHLAIIGAVLGRIHRAGESFPEPPRNRFDAAALAGRLEGLEGLAPSLAADAARLRDALAGLEAPPAPTTVVHGDLFRDNALFRDDALAAVIDFESASAGHPSFDLAVTMLAWCYGDCLEEALVRALFEGYRKERAISAEELSALFPAARAAAVRFAITRITDYELRPRGVVAYKDYRRFLARLAAVESLGEAGLRQLVG